MKNNKKHLLRILLLMFRVFQADPMTHQFSRMLLHDRYYCLQERPKLKLSFHGRKMAKFERSAPEIEGLVASSGQSPLIACSLDTGDRRLMSTFVER